MAGCAPDPGEVGYIDCAPYPVTSDCVIFICYKVIEPDRLSWWVQFGEYERVDCTNDGDCTDALEEAGDRQCPSE